MPNNNASPMNTYSRRRFNKRATRGVMDFTGSKYLPSEMPPVVNTVPWNHATIIVKQTSGTDLTIGLLRDNIKAQLGFANMEPVSDVKKDFSCEIRLQGFSAWSSDAITALPIDIVRGTSSLKDSQVELMRLDSFPMKNMFARIGFTFPLAVQATPLSSIRDKDQKVVVFICSKEVIIHCHLLWRGAHSKNLSLFYGFPPNRPTSRLRGHDFDLLMDEESIESVTARLLRIEALLTKRNSTDEPTSLGSSISDIGTVGLPDVNSPNSKG